MAADTRVRLTPDKVRAIRRLHGGIMDVPSLAEMYGVAQRTIRHVVDRTSWRWVKDV